MSLTGSLSKSAAPSGGIVTSDAATVNVPVGGDGKLEVFNQSDTGTVTLEFQQNSGSWNASVGSFTFANGDTIRARITSATAGESSVFSLRELNRNTITVAGSFTVAAV